MARTVTVSGWDAMLNDVARETEAQAPDILEIFAREALREIKPRWPVRTGRSRDALEVVRDGADVSIVCDVPHARYIHEQSLRGPTYIVRIVDYVGQNAERLAAQTSRKIRGGG